MASVLRQKRRWIVGLLQLATILAYIERRSPSVLAAMLLKPFGMSDYASSHLVYLFLFAYTIAYAPAVPFCDRLGVPASMTAACLPAFSRLAALAHAALAGSVRAIAIAHARPAWMITLTAIAVDLIADSNHGTAFGYTSVGGSLGGPIAAGVIPHILCVSRYLPFLVVMELLHPPALRLICRLGNRTPALPLIGQTI